MEYKKDKRTKNLTLRDIHVGDWVQVWSEETERYSPPLKITQICDDGTIYLVTDDEERCTPWEENIKDVDAIPIDNDILMGFGFVEDKSNPELLVYRIKGRKGAYPDNDIFAEKSKYDYNFYFNDYKDYEGNIGVEQLPVYDNFIHILQVVLHDFFGVSDLEWKGIEQ